MLTDRRLEETTGRLRRSEQQGEGVTAWAALVEDGRLRALAWVALPLRDFPNVHRLQRNGCSEADKIERFHFSRRLTQPECLGVYGQADLAEALASRSLPPLAWLRERGVDRGPVVRFVYKLRGDGSYGQVVLMSPTAPFESDEDASRWALGLRDACRPVFDGHGLCELPQLPSAPPSAADGPAAPASGPTP